MSAGQRARPVAISRAVLENYFHMSLNQASKELVSARWISTFSNHDTLCMIQGVCATAIKKACRLGMECIVE